jgi:hypothetical protein
VPKQSAKPIRRDKGEHVASSGSPKPPQPCKSLLACGSGEHTPMDEAATAAMKKRCSPAGTQLSQSPLGE